MILELMVLFGLLVGLYILYLVLSVSFSMYQNLMEGTYDMDEWQEYEEQQRRKR